MRQSAWINVSFVITALVAIGLALAALIIALDDDDPVIVGLDGASLADLFVDASLGDASAETPAAPARAAPAATPRDSLAERISALIDGRPHLGLFLTGPDDLTVRAVLPGGPAAQAGLQPGDRIVSLNGDQIDSPTDIVRSLEALQEGDVVNLGIERDGEISTVAIKLSRPRVGDLLPRPDRPNPDRQNPNGDRGAPTAPVIGLSVETTNAGLIVTAVAPGSGAAAAGLQTGDLLRALNGTPIPDREAVRAALAGLQPGDTVTLTIERDGASLDLAVRLAGDRRGRPETRPGFGGADGESLPERFRDFFERFFGAEGGGLPRPDGILPDGLFPDGEAFDLQVLRGEVTAFDDDSITIAGDAIVVDQSTRRPGGEVALGDTVIVFASGGVAQVIVPAPDFSRLPRPGNGLTET